ncbi:MAG TPA: CHASE3 domain-containing protein [Pilimelia sp.]|nr:CHASE3 domain-containing protein [Pilimelia sp.]
MRVAPAWTLRQRITALCVATSIVLVALAASAAGLAAASRGHLDRLVTQSGPVRVGGERLMTQLLDQEAAVRGYALTGRPDDLATYTAAVVEEEAVTRELRRLLADRPAERAQLERVSAQAGQWRRLVAEPAIAAVRSGGPAAAAPLLDDAARQRFDRLRATVEEFRESALRMRNELVDAARRTNRGLVLLLICAAAVVAVAGVALIALMHRLVTRPVVELASHVRQVASGDYGREIVGTGPPELTALARDIEAMRRKISDELSEVREARSQVQWINEQLQVQASELTRSNRDLEQFAYVASHDLQEPLRKVASFCQLLQRRYAGQLDERADQYIAFAVDGAQRMQRLINDLLAFSRIGRLTAGFTDVDLNALMGEVAAQLDTALEASGGSVTWDRLPVVEGEEPLLTTLFANLVSNSLKFRRPDVAPRVHVGAQRVGRQWEITVADNGIGIEPEFADKVFVIFQRLHARDAYEGTGIGLAIVKKIVEYHGGRVWLDPDAEEGTTIRFTLPESPVADADPAPPTQADSSSTAPSTAASTTAAPSGPAPPGTAPPRTASAQGPAKETVA